MPCASYPVHNFVHALDIVAAVYVVPVAHFTVSSGKTGTSLPVKILGKYDYLEAAYTTGEKQILQGPSVPLKEYGLTVVTPYKDGVAGLECTVFARDGMEDLYRRAMLRLAGSHAGHTIDCLCETEMWADAMLRYMRLYGQNPEFLAKVAEEIQWFRRDKMVNPSLG